ncbi:uncharacterized protein LOC116349759 [Contarinia nasturtii]|uniref:uncharacterized protein LOC116349759 n=1 Tax=Contarinia nasturtii TaxID=265458 RepID=UPI0012D496D1|nr:uncharacterized protein LOC116349759 [Contarinia nasturtii]
MKLTIKFLILLGIWSAAYSSSCSHWKKRMQKYGALVNCEYYITSEDTYTDYFPLDDVAKMNSNGTRQIRFFVLSQSMIKFKLSTNDTINIVNDNRGNGFDYRTTTTTENNNYYNRRGIYRNLHVSTYVSSDYEFVIGEGTNGYTESYIQQNDERLKSLVTPGIIRDNEPNEVLIEIDADGTIRTTINENTTIEKKVYDLDKLNYISFCSVTNKVLAEFFYNCNLN